MRVQFLPVLFAASLFGTASAQAQQFEPGQDVIVNPEAAAPIILHRHPQAPIHLHMPRHHRTQAATKASAPAPLAEAAPKAQPAPKPASKPKPIPAPAPESGGQTFSFPGDISTGAPPLSLQQMTKAPPSRPKAPVKPAPAPGPAKPAPVAPAPAAGTGLTKHSMILFAPKATDPASDALGAIKFLAGDLNAALANGSSRIQIQAFGGPRGDKGTDARRLSLKRALSIRQILIKDGVPASRIDVRAMGGADDGGPLDRVDVYIKS